MNKTVFRPPYVLIGKGAFPRHRYALELLAKAGTIVCTDGSADLALGNGVQPHVMIGDLDSTTLDLQTFKGKIIKAPEQNLTDMAKALNWCQQKHLEPLTLLAATGLREDHTLVNLHLLAEFCDRLSIRLVTDDFTVTCHRGKRTFNSFPGQLISVLPINPHDPLTISGLHYSLENTPLSSFSQGISNRAEKHEFTVDCQGHVWVFRSHPKA